MHLAIALLLAAGLPPAARAQNLDQIGVTLLQAMTTNLNGAGIRVAQPEADYDLGTNWEVNPGTAGHLPSLLNYISGAGSTTVFPNSLSSQSGHADSVAQYFYGIPNGIATNVVHVDNYDANFFITNYIFTGTTDYVFVLAPIPAATVVNQSFTFGSETTNLPTPVNYLAVSDQQEIDLAYDDYTVEYGVLFISAANNGGAVSPPGTAYNSIGVAAYRGSSGIGPTLDNGRCKPDITAPAGVTSFSTPQVSGAAAVLMQAALRGDGGSDTNAAFDIRTIKALLLNGAVKPADWTNSYSSPLDARYGSGILNVFNAYEQLAGGKQNAGATNLISIGAPHAPIPITNTIPTNSGWNNETISSGATNDTANHYFFNVSSGMATATLVWNRQFGQTNINDLDLFLFDTANSQLIACSTSRVDNVEHLFLPHLAAGRYDLQVLKNGGTNIVSNDETYALAFGFVPIQLTLMRAGPNSVLSWPVYPAGFGAEATTNLATTNWSTNALLAATLTGSTNILTVPMTNALQFFRLHQPNF